MSEVLENEKPKDWLLKIENKQKKYHRLAHEIGAGSPCLLCGDKCPGLDLHFWRKICKNCKCKKDDHDVKEEDKTEHFEILFGKNGIKVKQQKTVLEVKLQNAKNPKEFSIKKVSLDWVPPNISPEMASEYLEFLPSNKIPLSGCNGALYRRQQIQRQIPLHDFNPALCHELSPTEINEMESYAASVRKNVVGQAQVVRTPIAKWLTSSSNTSATLKSPNVSHLLEHKHLGVNEERAQQERLHPSLFQPNSLKFDSKKIYGHEVSGNIPQDVNVINKNLNTMLDPSSGLNRNIDINVWNSLERSTEVNALSPMYSSLLRTGNRNLLTNKPEDDDCYILQDEKHTVNDDVSASDNKNTMLQDGKYLTVKNKNVHISSSEILPSAHHEVGGTGPLKITKKCPHFDSNVMPCASGINQEGQTICLECNNGQGPAYSSSVGLKTTIFPLVKDQNPIGRTINSDYNYRYCCASSNLNETKHTNNYDRAQFDNQPFKAQNYSPGHVRNDEEIKNQKISSFVSNDYSDKQLKPLGGYGPSLLNKDKKINDMHCQDKLWTSDSTVQASQNMKLLSIEDVIYCQECNETVEPGSIGVVVTKDSTLVWHPKCFVCSECKELLVDLLYFYKKGKVYCGRDYAFICGIPRCYACDELIFINKYTQAEGHSFHLKHFCCSVCDILLPDKSYTPINDLPVCLDCYDKVYAEVCDTCKMAISADQTSFRLDDLIWHTSCFACYHCKKNLSPREGIIYRKKPFCNKTCVRSSATV